MRHRVRGRKLGRTASHRKAMFRNMACSLIRSTRVDDDDPGRPKVPGRIVTTVAKAKELRPFVEKLVTIARKAIEHQENSQQYATQAERNTGEWKTWRESSEWNKWNQAIAPAVTYRRRAFAMLRDKEAVSILFADLGPRFADRLGGYTRIVRLATVRLGDAGAQALIEFVGDRDRVKSKRTGPTVASDETEENDSATTDSESEESSTTEDDATTESADTSVESDDAGETESDSSDDGDESSQDDTSEPESKED